MKQSTMWRLAVLGAVVTTVAWAVLLSSIGYVVVHFLRKYW